MRALLILNADNGNAKVIVTLSGTAAKERVIALLEGGRVRAAFDLLKAEAEVTVFLHKGARMRQLPDVTLVEDLIGD